MQAALAAAGSAAVLEETPETTQTAEQAAAACGAAVARIVTSLVFRDGPEGPGVLALASGANRAHEKRQGRVLGVRLVRADADLVREATGYAVGGAPRCVLEIAPADPARIAGGWAIAAVAMSGPMRISSIDERVYSRGRSHIFVS